jgi:hypothetical protein
VTAVEEEIVHPARIIPLRRQLEEHAEIVSFPQPLGRDRLEMVENVLRVVG